MTDFLREVFSYLVPRVALEESIARLLRVAESNRILDLASGRAGPIVPVWRRLRLVLGRAVRICLTDRYPNLTTHSYLDRISSGEITYLAEPVDALVASGFLPADRIDLPMALESALKSLSLQLDYSFRNEALLTEALTHRSAASINNERLEFLGDGILNFIIAASLFEHYPDINEGDLSRLRASLVNRDSLADIAKSLDLGQYIKLGSGELKSGGRRRDSILADAVEAILGAVYLDSGFDNCRALILRLYQDKLRNIPDVQELKDPKTRTPGMSITLLANVVLVLGALFGLLKVMSGE